MLLILHLCISLIGLYTHWLNRWAKNKTTLSFFDYMRNEGKYSIATITTVFAGVIALLSQQEDLTTQSLALSYGIGYTGDSLINKE